MFKLKKKSVSVDYITCISCSLRSSLETIGHRNSLVLRGFRTVLCSFITFSSSYFTVPCLACTWHATRTRHAKQQVRSVLACTTKATVTSIMLLFKYVHMPWNMSRSACRGMHACPCHLLFVGFPMDGHIYLKYTLVMLGRFLSMLRRYGKISLHTCLMLLNLYKEDLWE